MNENNNFKKHKIALIKTRIFFIIDTKRDCKIEVID